MSKKMGPIGNRETSVLTQLTPRNNPEDGGIHSVLCFKTESNDPERDSEEKATDEALNMTKCATLLDALALPEVLGSYGQVFCITDTLSQTSGNKYRLYVAV